jgi:uncharacterized protein (TIGR02145 family)
LSIILLVAVMMFGGCKAISKVTVINPSTCDAGVVINGVKWATRNLDVPKTFAATPEAAGKFYQWNRAKAWADTGRYAQALAATDDITGWTRFDHDGDSWTVDISPAGWRLPTKEEIETLFDKTKVTHKKTTQNGVNGRLFTDIASGNTLFLPAAGFRYYFDGTLDSAGYDGYYWSSSTTSNGIGTYILHLDLDSTYFPNSYRTYGLSVRCVAALMTDTPAETTDKTVAWSSSDNTVATVAEGKVDSKKATCEATAIAPSTDTVVVINGVKWATRNVDTLKTFAATPEAAGKFYQWNHTKAWADTEHFAATPEAALKFFQRNRDHNKSWNTIDTTVFDWAWDWNWSLLYGDKWTADICPAGWRLPTKAELETLLDETKVTYMWTTQNSVEGGLFTDIASGKTLFLPAAGNRHYAYGELINAGYAGYYWSSTVYNTDEAYYLYFDSDDIYMARYFRWFGLSVRCVAE